MSRQAYTGLSLALLLAVAALFFLVSCSGSSSSAALATVRVSLSDPATCAAPHGPFSHVYVIVTDPPERDCACR
jgi:hypothetical protein